MNELAKKTVSFSEIERYSPYYLMKNLVWDNYSGELIGFVDLVDIINYATVLQLLPLVELQRFELCLFWQAVKYSEGMNLKVIAATADEASKK